MSGPYDPAAFPPFAVTVDIVVLSARSELQVLLIRRGEEPFAGQWALPGGFVRERESIADAALRELAEESGLDAPTRLHTHLEQLATFGDVERDPRMRVVSVAHFALVAALPDPTAGTDAADAAWTPVDQMSVMDLAFDHSQIIDLAVARVRAKLEYSTLATRLVGSEFTLSDLHRVYQVVWGMPLDLANFRRKVLGTDGFVVPTGGHRQQPGGGPPAALYRPGDGTWLNPPLTRE